MSCFFRWRELCEAALDGTRKLLVEHCTEPKLVDPAGFWGGLHRMVELKHAHGSSAEAILSPTVASLGCEVAAWRAAGMSHHVRPFRLSPEAGNEFAAALRVWTTSLRGLTQGVTRILLSAHVRSCEPAQSLSACVEAV